MADLRRNGSYGQRPGNSSADQHDGSPSAGAAGARQKEDGSKAVVTALRRLGFWEPKPLLGDWFRSERERLGIARDLLAARLGVKGWRVEQVETDKPPAQVPAEWIATLIALGFIDSRR